MDIAVIPGNVPGWVIHTSGTHGVEGYAGSAIQLAALELLLRQPLSSSSSPPRPTLVLVHAVNPHGMAHDRRVNENNVDLNRNALTRELWETYAQPRPPHPPHFNRDTYDLMDPRLFRLSTGAPRLWWSALELAVKGLFALIRHGHTAVKRSMVGGQYHVPNGIFYGGNGKAEPSLHELRTWLFEEFIPHYSNNNNNNNNATTNTSNNTTPIHHGVTWIDVHTGLGPFGVDTLLMKVRSDERAALEAQHQQQQQPDDEPKQMCSEKAAKAVAWKHFESVADELDHWFPGCHHPFGNKASQQVSQGYENVRGFISDYFPEVFSPQQQDTLRILTQEFGTINTLWVALSLVLENAAYQHLPPAEAKQWAHYTTRRAFDPLHFGWRQKVLSRGMITLQQAMERSMQLSATTATTTITMTTTTSESS